MATESGFITLEDLKRQAEETGHEGKKKTKFFTQGWKIIQENEVRKLKLAAEAEERKLAAEERKLAAEAEERKVAAEAEEKNGCRSGGKEIGCRGSGTGSGEKTQSGDGKVAIRKRETE